MSKLKITQNKRKETIDSIPGASLLQLIRSEGFEIIAPCGGNGTCGKCRVEIKGEDFVSSCVYYPDHDIEVLLPGKLESQILTTQYEFSAKIALFPGEAALLASYPLGVAIDIGTSTIVFYLVNLITGSILETKGLINPQVKYGADVISRIQFCAQANGLKELQNEIIHSINKELILFAKKTGVDTSQIVKITVAGNTTMLHLLLGVNPTSIALAPFTPTFTEAKKILGSEVGIEAEAAEIHILPSISAYVGADIVAGLASLSPPENIKNYLFIDIGTNGEIALVTPEKIYCCATAAGPAFEGANISCGMGALSGAIASYSGRDKFTTISNDPPAGICGSGLIDILAFMLNEKLVAPDGLLESEFIIKPAHKGQQTISVNQQDIREIQLAKAAIIAGIKILVKIAKLEFDQVDALFLAGGFGNYINVESAITIGLLPEEMKNKIFPVGNASGTGTTLALKSVYFEQELEQIISRTEYVELSSHEDFVLEYAMNMGFK